MAEVTLSEARAMLRDMETAVSDLLTAFSKKTGLVIDGIDVMNVQTMSDKVVVHVSIEANL